MKRLTRELDFIQQSYRRLLKAFEPTECEPTDPSSVRVYLCSLKGLERCVKLRLKVNQMIGSAEEEAAGELRRLDMSKLSDQALHEIQAALRPVDK